MTPFTQHSGRALPLDRDNIDTDQIVPARFLYRSRTAGYSDQLFRDLRYFPDDELNPEFELNQPEFAKATILISGHNFGCGSSREQAVWALIDYGFKVVIAPDFGDIFFNNSLKNGLLTITLPEEKILEMLSEAHSDPDAMIKIDLESQHVITKRETLYFDIDSHRKDALISGASEIEMTLRSIDKIIDFEQKHLRSNPWITSYQ